MKTAILVLALALVGTAADAKGFKGKRGLASSPNRNVQIGGSEFNSDACPGTGAALVTTVLLRNDEKGFLSYKDTVAAGEDVWVCDNNKDTGMVGIVVMKPNTNCFVGDTSKRKDYTGPCKSGWVKKDYLMGIAGGGF